MIAFYDFYKLCNYYHKMKHSFWVKFTETLHQLTCIYTPKALRTYNVKEYHILFGSNSTPLALIENEGENFLSK